MANDRLCFKVIVELLLLFSLFATNSLLANCDSDVNNNNNNNDRNEKAPGNFKIQIVNRGNVGVLQSSHRQDTQDNNFGYQKWKINEQGGGVPNFKVVSNNNNTILNNDDNDQPPPYYEVAKMARYIVKKSNWTSIATISTRGPTAGFPFANIFSISDGPIGKSTGVPYMFVTPLDISIQDLKKNSRASLTMSLAQGAYCSNNLLDPEDPRCAHVILSGAMTKLVNGSDEETFARLSMFSRHPVMSEWPKDHGFFFAKLNIDNILLLDYFGGAKTVDVKEYYKARV